MTEKTTGYLVPIGGAEEKEEDPAILERLVSLAGSETAEIAVLPTASTVRTKGARYAQIFEHLGANSARSVPVRSRENAFSSEVIECIEEATLIFITGGNQLRLTTILGGTPVAKAIRGQFKNGVHVAGTSAGAAIMPEHMIAGGKPGATPTARSVMMAPGLGLTNRITIDQHFRERDRLGRLLAAISFNPYLIGIGLDEDTAVFMRPDGECEVVGSGGVTVVDPHELEASTMGHDAVQKPVNLASLKLHSLAHGAHFNLKTRKVTIPG